MSGFPQHPACIGRNVLLGEEYALAVTGWIPRRLRPQVDGWWVSAERLVQAA